MPEYSRIKKQEETDLLAQASSLGKELKAENKIIGEITEKRERNVKHFIKEDYTFEAAVYPLPVHFLEGGKWRGIDNNLIDSKDEDNTDVLENKKNDFKVKFAKKANKTKLIKITKDKYEIVWGIDKKNKIITADSLISSTAEVVPKNQPMQNNLSENDKKEFLPNISSQVIYPNVFENIDLKYIINSSEIKENIVIKQRLEDYVFNFSLSTKGLIPTLQKDNSISFYDSVETSRVVFRMKPPVMYDSKSDFSSNIVVLLSGSNNSYILEMQLDARWINSSDRVFPITIDPTVETPIDINKIEDSFVSEGFPTTNYKELYLLKVGYGSSSRRNRSYFKFELPSLKTSELIVKARFHAALETTNNTPNQVNVHKVTGDWSSGNITWNNAPSYDAIVEDYSIVQGAAGDLFYWDVTNIVKEFYNTGNNYGLMLKNNNEATGYYQFLSSDYSADPNAPGRPRIQIAYVNNTGLESYWTYRAQSVGRAGTGYVNDFNGTLTFVHDDLIMNGNRMPINLKHVYNQNDKDSSMGFGYGWRLNLSQRITEENFSDGLRYKLIDEDATAHYFKLNEDGVIKDESGVDLTLTKNTDGTYTIKDNKDNEMNFTSTGYLKNLKDSNGNTLTLNYGEVVLISVVDGAGRTTYLDYYSSGFLKAIRDPAGRTTSFDYSAALQLISITYPDGRKTIFTYDSANKLLSAKNYDGYKVVYDYNTGIANRVNRIYETHDNGSKGGELYLRYGNNSTLFFDYRARTNVYQFNNYGNTIGIIDNGGKAQYYQYIRDDKNSSKRNKLSLESRLQGTVVNYIKNHNAETSSNWVYYYTGSSLGNCSFSNEEKFIGNQSIKIVKTNNVDRHYASQGVTLQRGKVYTLSCYTRTIGVSNTKNKGASVYVTYEYKQGQWVTVESSYLNGTQQWTRQEASFTLPSDSYSDTVFASVSLYDETGTAYFDCFQLEEGATATRYNLVENSALLYGEPMPEFWQGNGYIDSGDRIVTETEGFYPQIYGNKSFRMNGAATAQKALYQNINVSGVKDEVFVLAGWGKGKSVSLELDNSRAFGLAIGFIPSVGEIIWKGLSFNIDSPDWQYAATRIAVPIDFVQIRYYVMYYKNANTAYFTGLQLYKEEFGTSFGYDDKGNINTVTEIAKQESQFQYDGKNDLIKFSDPKGYNYTYEYDYKDAASRKHNLTKAISAQNVVYSFTYDDYGNPFTAKIGEGTLFIENTAIYDADSNNNYIKTIKDSIGNIVTYSYNSTKGTLENVIDPKEKSTDYAYDSNLDRLLRVSKIADGKEASNSYTYENDRIKTVTHNGFSYNFVYSSLGNNTEVSVGSQKLIENTYVYRTGLLEQALYGNGDAVGFQYDNLDRIIIKKYNGTERHKYQYDAYGNLNYHEDLVNKLQYRYSYDLADRLVKVAISNGDSIRYDYDKNNNITSIMDIVNNYWFPTSYNYDNDNKLKIINYYRLNEANVYFNYDSLGRLSDKTISVGGTNYKISYGYKAGLNGSNTNKVESINNNGKIISYTYDANGNIQTITQNGKIITYQYNELNELLIEDNGVLNIKFVYTYDIGGNILTKSEYNLTTGAALSPTKVYAYVDTNWKDTLTSFDGKAVISDAIGNVISYSVYSYAWEEGRQLASITGNGKTIAFKYNDNGIRTEKTVNGVLSKYRIIGNRVSYEYNGTDFMYYTYDSNNNLVGAVINNIEYHYIKNIQGDIIALINNAGAEVVSYTYDSWGKLISIKDYLGRDVTNDINHVGYKNPYRYRGYRFDNETGLYYLQSRYYNPEWGRFINADAIIGVTGELLGHNLFAYTKNNPVNMKDTNGFLSFSASDDAAGTGERNWIGADEISIAKDVYFAKKSTENIHTVSKGINSHKGKIRIWGSGSDKYLSKPQYVLSTFKNSFKLKEIVGKSSLISLGIAGVDNYISAGGVNKQFFIGWAVDTVSGILIGAGTIALVSGGVALLGVSAPGWAIAGVAAGVSYIASDLIKQPVQEIKDRVY